jgi:hypothetical protein
MNVTVTNESGVIIGSAITLTGPVPSDAPGYPGIKVQCNLEWTVSNLPRASFYPIEIGRRGTVTYSFDEMTQMDWMVSLSLGV